MDKIKLQAIIAAHDRWVKGLPNGERANLSDADLSYMDLSDVDLRAAHMINTSFVGTKLTRANFSGAFLRQSNFTDARCDETNFCRAYMDGAILYGASAIWADFCEAELAAIDWRAADLQRARFTDKIIQAGPVGVAQDYAIYNATLDEIFYVGWDKWSKGALADFKATIEAYYPSNKYKDELRRVIAYFEAEKAALI